MSESRAEYDAVIVGSGFGGAVAACRLAQAGRNVLVLERGRRWNISDYPRQIGDAWLYDSGQPYRRNGWFEFRLLSRRMVVVAGAGVGGGSLLYANVSIDAPPAVFNTGWPTAINPAALEPYYRQVADMLKPRPIPDGQHPRRLELMQSAAQAIGASHRFKKLDLAVTFNDQDSRSSGEALRNSRPHLNEYSRTQGTCTHCGHCVIGCKARAKNTLDLNYLAVAEDAGALIRSLCQVSHVSRNADLWQVHFRDALDGSHELQTVTARRIILSAGSIGSTEILLRSRSEFGTLPNLPAALGSGWSANGSFFTLARYGARRVSPTMGPTITSAIDFSDDRQGGGSFIEDGGAWNWMDLLFDARRGIDSGFPIARPITRRLRQAMEFDSVMPWFGQGADSADGRLYLGRRWRNPNRHCLKLAWNPARSSQAIDDVARMHKILALASDGKPLPQTNWSLFKALITPHPLGGCCMAATPATGVVDHAAQVFGQPGLYVMDGSIIPRAIGRNPSKTIAALAERAVHLLLSETDKS